MSTYLSNLLTTTTSRYNTLRRTLLSNEDDGNTEDDSHISRVLRAYYTEKERPFPPWLPPDPNDRRAITPQPGYGGQQQTSGYFTGAQMRVGQQQGGTGGNRGSLSDLWDPSPTPTQQSMQPQSLRAGRRPMGAAQPSSNTLAPSSAAQARPLPSQRAGSYQTMQQTQSARSSIDPSPPTTSSGGGTAQERLKARLWGAGRTTSSTSVNSVGSSGAYDQGGGSAGGGGAYDTGSTSRRYGRG